jgi:hypothetical protein
MKIEQEKHFRPIVITVEGEFEAKVLEAALAYTDSIQVVKRYPEINRVWSGEMLMDWRAKLASMIRK